MIKSIVGFEPLLALGDQPEQPIPLPRRAMLFIFATVVCLDHTYGFPCRRSRIVRKTGRECRI